MFVRIFPSKSINSFLIVYRLLNRSSLYTPFSSIFLKLSFTAATSSWQVMPYKVSLVFRTFTDIVPINANLNRECRHSYVDIYTSVVCFLFFFSSSPHSTTKQTKQSREDKDKNKRNKRRQEQTTFHTSQLAKRTAVNRLVTAKGKWILRIQYL